MMAPVSASIAKHTVTTFFHARRLLVQRRPGSADCRAGVGSVGVAISCELAFLRLNDDTSNRLAAFGHLNCSFRKRSI